MTTEERTEKLNFIYETADILGEFVHNVELWTDDEIEYNYQLYNERLEQLEQ